MQLSCRGRYTLRAMIELAKNFDGNPLPLSYIEETQGISKKYLTQLMGSLKLTGLIKVIRGKNGGYKLARHPSEITLADILHATEGDMSIVECVNDEMYCDRHTNCISHLLWVELSTLINDYLGSVSLEKILKKDAVLMKKAK